jgi:hypothetical protein
MIPQTGRRRQGKTDRLASIGPPAVRMARYVRI